MHNLQERIEALEKQCGSNDATSSLYKRVHSLLQRLQQLDQGVDFFAQQQADELAKASAHNKMF